MSYSIEFLDESNTSLLAAVAPDVFDNAIDPQQLAAFVADPRHRMVLAIDDELVVGMASAVEYYHPDKTPQLWINEVGVAPPCQRRGIGRALVKKLIDNARETGCSGAWLGTETDNLAAQRCYAAIQDKEPEAFLLYEWELEERDSPNA